MAENTGHPEGSEFDPKAEGQTGPLHGGVPIEQEGGADEPQPRRAASAEFIVQSEVGSEAAMREAMDPAHKSLADALRLSYRVLQVVIIILIVLFLVSGFQTVSENQSGVLTRFGAIVPVDGKEALDPGLQRAWPYPIGEFVLFDVQNRSIELTVPAGRPRPGRGVFWPSLEGRESLEAAIAAATTSDFLMPGRDGTLITRDGDLAHLKITVNYEITDPVSYVKALSNDRRQADRVVQLATQRAAIHVAARTSLQELLEVGGATGVKYDIRNGAQRFLDEMNTGITINGVNVPDTTPPLAIRKTFTELGDVREQTQSQITQARQEAKRRLLQIAGESYDELRDLIGRYEEAVDRGEEDEAAALLEEIKTVLESPSTFGQVASITARSRAYEAEVESTLGVEARKVQSLLPTFRRNPDLIVKQAWIEAYTTVLNRPDVETYYVPPGLGNVKMMIAGLQRVQEIRRRQRLERSEQGRVSDVLSGRDLDLEGMTTAEQMNLEGPGRQLRVDEEGRVRGLGQGD